jgi:hypothetical protein
MLLSVELYIYFNWTNSAIPRFIMARYFGKSGENTYDVDILFVLYAFLPTGYAVTDGSSSLL